MKAYTVSVSFELVLSWLRNGARPMQQITITHGVPESGHLIDTRVHNTSNMLEFLFITDEPGEFPEACDIWSLATQVMPNITVTTP